jgi:hypothetical protein
MPSQARRRGNSKRALARRVVLPEGSAPVQDAYETNMG